MFGFSLFLITLQDFYFSSVGAALFPVIGVMLAFLCVLLKERISAYYFFYVFGCFIFLIYLSIIDVVRYGYYGTTIGGAINLVFIVSLLSCYGLRMSALKPIITLVVLLHLLFWFAQVLVWFVGGFYLDFVEHLTGDTSRYSSLKSLVIQGQRIPRFAGLYLEPGTYSVWMIALLVARYVIDYKFDVVSILAILSMFFSMSLFGVVLGLLFVMFVVAHRLNFRVFIASFLVVLFFFIMILQPVFDRFNSDYSEMDLRLNMLFLIMDAGNYFFGYGLFSEKSVAINDSGVPFFLIYSYGYLALVLLMLLVAFACRWRFYLMLLFVIILMTKIKLAYPLFWFVLSVFYLKSRQCYEYERISPLK